MGSGGWIVFRRPRTVQSYGLALLGGVRTTRRVDLVGATRLGTSRRTWSAKTGESVPACMETGWSKPQETMDSPGASPFSTPALLGHWLALTCSAALGSEAALTMTSSR